MAIVVFRLYANQEYTQSSNMSKGDGLQFSSKDAEIQYWKGLAEEYLQEIERIQKESDEFIVESQQLEKEYEATIEQNEKKIKDLSLANNKAQNEIDSLKGLGTKNDDLEKVKRINEESLPVLKEHSIQLLRGMLC
ncbi:unnamed protein product, partial [Callosobruchus maculatus]